jgi:hypothetical protein
LDATITRYFPDISSIEVVMPAWNKAPSGDGVTILFTFIPDMKEMENRQEMLGVDFVSKMIHDFHTQVRYSMRVFCKTHYKNGLLRVLLYYLNPITPPKKTPTSPI